MFLHTDNRMSLTGYALCIVLGLTTVCRGDNPGMKVRVAESFLDSGVQFLIKTMQEGMSSVTLPDISGSASMEGDEMKYTLRQIQISNLTCTSASSAFVPKTGVKVSLKDCDAIINCISDVDSWFLKDIGKATITLKKITATMVLGIRRSLAGVLSIAMQDCQSEIGKTDVNVASTVAFVYDTLKGPIEQMVQSSIKEQLCSALRMQVVSWNESLNHLNMHYMFTDLIMADLSVEGEVEITSTYTDIGMNGQFNTFDKAKGDFSPAPMTFPDHTGRQSSAGVSEASLNSLTSAFYKSGSLNAMLSNVLESINLTTSELEVPEISQRYKSPAPVKMTLIATQAPKVYLKPNNVTLEFFGLIQAHDVTEPSKQQLLLGERIVAALDTSMSLSSATGFPGLILSGSVGLNRIQINKSKPEGTSSKVVATEAATQKLFNQLLSPINGKLKEGMPINSTLLMNPSVSIEEGFAWVKVDFVLN
ncbi:BPI fold-containing family C protein-like isoform X2 [Hyperolius riggenbachi]|uniref:BPI fold-containing family C protein-like isoform X2 n=1 Tax=Hyperolius riggenbachi TaxID=752182 RepID=UPI0035A35253